MKKLLIILFAGLLLISCKKDTVIVRTETGDLATIDSTSDRKGIPAGPVANTILTAEYVKHIGAIAYLWGWPMVNIHNRKVMFEKLPGPLYKGGVVPLSPPNQLCMLTDYIKPGEKDVTCPNQDVVYGFGLTDFSKVDALVVQVPDFGDRFWVYQVCNQRTDGYATLGKMYGTKPGFYLLTGPKWSGKVPDGITGIFKCDTNLGVVIPRVFQTDDPADKKGIQPILQKILMYSVSEFDGKVKTKDWTKIPVLPSPPSTSNEETKWVKPEVFFDELPIILKEVPPLPGEEAIYGQIKSVIAAAAKDPKIKDMLKEAAVEADQKLIAPLFQFENVGYPLKDNWTTQGNGAQFGLDYLTRTACAKANIFVNKPNETKYFYQDKDAVGIRLNGGSNYTVTFAKGEVPPVKGFWSLTLYNQYHFFSPNPISRFSLGTKNKDLKYNPDGSLTLYVQNTQPSIDKISNWLPSPKETFSLYIRCYWPEDRVVKDTWLPPAVLKAK
ncbi:DUF1254 domain-containing protein [Flavobacterium hibernum]|uniref:DUF1254 domain-containing protein n=1 Tax=Flavobacterium hibernum TaxID=37752 RepID=A0A0D0EDQ5_9FLAO|nr:DUF1214 domain-containing protein [Flavobacterium hibernum]KIO51014.1 hypothetical protein IW18_20110 [Flavobacterium hibernum]OXA86150.1 hypothetical protein B0A73_14950 [Flavobacterium hibernum]STO14605.1 Uncharacterized conserved protein [Flavobacterium hibernum]